MAQAKDRTKMVDISPEKLREALRKRQLTASGIDAEMGSGCSMTNAVARGRISAPMLKILEKVYSIEPGEIIIDRPTSRRAEKELGAGWVSEMRRFAIYPELVAFVQGEDFKRAVKEAVKEVMEE